ncbi:DCN1-like protein 5 [Hypsizygus marmoreus]|uniref:Defective in cullin neddylation protein n=1 Tax=Hypsizygus marmoreus TaxID=39966 RepID=A0A369JPD7_HYPMA|nr:DCN1-like protein 5 [Hypsizygus marmoreus]
MPPKRKHAETAGAEASTSTRATRSSTRSAAASKASKPAAPKKSTAKKAAPQKSGEQVDGETSAPPAKKSRTAKAVPKPAADKTKSTGKASDPSLSGSADKSGAGASFKTDDDLGHNKSPPLTTLSTTTTSSTPPPKQVVQAAKAPPAKAQPPTSSIEPYTTKRSLALFKSYADSDDPNVIGPEGFERICTDANIPFDGTLPLILAWQLGAKEMGKITIVEWTTGMDVLKISSLPALDLAIHDLENILILGKPIPTKKTQREPYDKTSFWKYCEDTKDAFHKLYLFCFSLAKPEQSRNIDMETATALWSVLLVPKFPLMGEVISFITERGSYKAANKDLWSMMLEFCETVNPNLSDYEGEGAWPTLLDDFVLSKKAQQATTSCFVPTIS